MMPMPPKKSGPKDYVGEELGAMKGGGAKYESVEDLLLAALGKLADNEHGERLMGHRRKMRGEPEPMESAAHEAGESSGEEMREDGGGEMPEACQMGECEHPEHQREDSLPDELES